MRRLVLGGHIIAHPRDHGSTAPMLVKQRVLVTSQPSFAGPLAMSISRASTPRNKMTAPEVDAGNLLLQDTLGSTELDLLGSSIGESLTVS